MSTLAFTLPAALPAAEAVRVGNPTLNIAIFVIFVVFTLTVVIKVAAGKKTAAEYYTAGSAFTGRQNGWAITGDYLSAASFLGIAGAVAIQGLDGFLFSIGYLVAWLVALLLTAELMRNTGRFTLADVVSFRLRQRPVRIAAATSSLTVSFFYLLAQMAGAGGLVSLLLGLDRRWAQNIVIAIVGAVMIGYVMIGGMKGTTWVQIIKAILLVSGTAIITIWVLGMYGFNLSQLLQGAVNTSPAGEKLLEPGLRYGANLTSKLDFISLSMAIVLGTAGLPHVLIRFYTVPTSKQARKSVEWAIWLIGGFYLLTLVIGYGAAAMVGPDQIMAAPGAANSAAPLLAYALGGSWLLGIISGIAFATILAVVAGLTITTSATFAHDLYNEVIKRGKATPEQEVKVARTTALIFGVVGVVGGILAYGQNIAFLVALAFAVAASANLPTIIYSLFWRRFNTRGALWSMYGGLISAVGLILFSPVVSGKVNAQGQVVSMITNPNIDFSWFPLENPGIVSIPLAFFLGWLGTVTSSETNAVKYAEMEVRSLTGAGANIKALDH
ncbi:cation/acetate symporter [Kineosphaera limosa]|uniref:Acetate permease n=1 Tax=Kineosphaera limosa NBRC 100340 TaxID=1184609 RepID=K6WDA8_9MICO|nr:cation acetate symporter [Kineosphaera limosa]NYE00162.1 cation/acetate symporter [Kineosphaera limosa]GAB97260.1 acetate permease [Kineosphaera limosa NBRC 100340]